MSDTIQKLIHRARNERAMSSTQMAVSLAFGAAGTLAGLLGTANGSPVLVLAGYGVSVPAVVYATGLDAFRRERARELVSLGQYQAALDAAFRDGYASGKDRGEVEARAEAERQCRAEIEAIQRESKQQLACVAGEHQQAIQAERRKLRSDYDAELAERDSEIERLRARLAGFGAEQSRLDSLRAELEMREREIRAEINAINESKLWLAQQQGRIEALQNELASKDSAIAELQARINALCEEYSDALQSERAAGYDAGLKAASATFSLEIEKLHAQCSRLRLELERLEAFKSLDRSLPELASILNKRLSPAFVVGDQGSGKALTAAKLAEIYSAGADGVVIFVLDISEGGNPDSSWARLGIPVTSDASLFVRVLEAVKAQLDNPNSPLPFRNRPEQYRSAPPIVVVVDEALTAFDSLEAGALKSIIDCLRAIESRGSKRKVFCVACSTDDQIQNISVKPIKGEKVALWNTGVLRNYLRIYLNQALIARASDEELKANSSLKQYLSSYGGSHFVSAIEWVDERGQHLKPFKHCSHHGHLLHEVKPSRLANLRLAAPPIWFPKAARELFQPDSEPPQQTESEPSVSLNREKPASGAPPTLRGVAGGDAGGDFGGAEKLSELESQIRELAARGVVRVADIAREIAGLKPSRSPKYRELSDKIKAVLASLEL